jgi:hypothetical protein
MGKIQKQVLRERFAGLYETARQLRPVGTPPPGSG